MIELNEGLKLTQERYLRASGREATRLKLSVDLNWDRDHEALIKPLFEAVAILRAALCQHLRSEVRGLSRYCLDCEVELPYDRHRVVHVDDIGLQPPLYELRELPEQCWHPTWAWRKGIGPAYKDKPMQRYCTQCNQNLRSHPELERAHRPYAVCSHPDCPQCKLEDEEAVR